MGELTLPAAVESIGQVTDFVNEFLDTLTCSQKARIQLDIAIDEIMSNIAHYAYPSGTGTVTVAAAAVLDPLSVVLTFMDSGTPFNPLEVRDPDITLPTEERQPGGLGIYLVKKSMDAVSYEYRDGKNILQIRKMMAEERF